MPHKIYLDNAATTKALPSVCEAVGNALAGDYGNPSSLHSIGVVAEELVSAVRRRLALALGVPERGIAFTSGGTESDNMAILGAAHSYQRRGKHIITSAIEHKAVLASCEALEKNGWRITRVGVNKTGQISPAAVAEAVEEDTVLVSIMAVNNEVGTIQPLESIVRAVRTVKKDVLFHTDAVQALGKIPFHPSRLGLDLVTVSAHKVHGPKGCGALWVRDGVRLQPIVFGGGQEAGLRPGTENVPGIAGFGAALDELAKIDSDGWLGLAELRDLLVKLIQELIPGAVINSPGGMECAPHIVSVGFPGLRGEVLIHALAERGVFVSSGSACSALRRNANSHVLTAMNLPKQNIEGSLRFSLSMQNTREEIGQAAELLEQVITQLGGVSNH